MPEPLLELDRVSVLSLRDVSLQIRPGDRLAVVGASGSGKSVLLSVCLGFLAPTGGRVRWNGRAASRRELPPPTWGVAFQEPALMDDRSIRQNLLLSGPREAQHDLAELGLGHLDAGTPAGVLSGGQQKRVAVYRALRRAQDLLILDEPSSGLDPLTADRIASYLSAHLEASRCAMLLLTHDYRMALSLCSRILLLTNGRLVDITPSSGEGPDRIRQLEEAIRRHDETVSSVRPSASDTSGYGAVLWESVRQAVPMAVLMMIPVGLVVTIQGSGVGFMDFSRFVPAALVAAVFRELGPLVVGLLLSARLGTRVAGAAAAMSYTRQLDALRIHRVDVRRYLLWPNLAAASLAFPIAISAGAFAAIAAGAAYADSSFSRLHVGSRRFLLLAGDALSGDLLVALVLKGVLMGAAVTMASYIIGSRPVRSASDLGRSMTTSVVVSASAVVLVDVVVSTIIFYR